MVGANQHRDLHVFDFLEGREQAMNITSYWETTSPVSLMTGYAFGSRHMTMRVSIRMAVLNQSQQHEISSWFHQHADIATELVMGHDGWEGSVDLLLQIMCKLQQSLGFPLCESGIRQILPSGEVRLFIPLHRGTFVLLANLFQCVLQILNVAMQGDLSRHPAAELNYSVKALQRFRPATGNVRGFMEAAYQAGIPLQRLPGNATLYGQGVLSRLLESSFTDRTPSIGCQQARSKPVASEILRLYGLPVQAHKVVQDISSALAAAEKIGYPVVVKPTDRDRGEGVAADLRTPEQLDSACRIAFSLSKNVMVEKHFYGKDYRITVLDGRVIWAVERVPGGVTGDGVSTVKQLIEQLNLEPDRNDSRYSALKQLHLDEEALTLLAQENLTPESILPAGQFVSLRRISNITRGGVPVAVTDQVHPDNRRLAERAANVLRLDLAGVDLLIPDIRQSWRQSGAAICEVNAQPTIGSYTAGHLYGEILQHLLKGNGRIPVILVAGGRCVEYSREIGTALSAAGYDCGVYDGQEITINGTKAEALAKDVFAAGKLLVMDPSVSAVVVALTDASVLEQGLPFQRYDILVADCSGFALHKDLLNMIVPACDGCILTVNGTADLQNTAAGVMVSGTDTLEADAVIHLLESCQGLQAL